VAVCDKFSVAGTAIDPSLGTLVMLRTATSDAISSCSGITAPITYTVVY
jgi:hypothetical protein